MTPELDQIAIVVPSCDRYASLWPISISALQRHWTPRPPSMYLIANRRHYAHDGVEQILVGEDISWSDNLLKALESIPHDFIFMALDDLVMLPGVACDALNAALARAVRERWDYLRVNPLPRPTQADAEGLGRVLPGEVYRSATVWSLWRKEVLRQVLKPGENPWQFEKSGSTRTDRFTEWYASAIRRVPYVNVVTAGRTDPDVLRRLAALGHEVNKIDFLPMSGGEYAKHRFRLLRSKLLRWVPVRWRRSVLHTFTKA